MTQSNLYNYVSSKQDVLFMVCDHLVSLYRTAVDEAVAISGNPHAALVQAVRAIIAIMSEHKDELQLLYNETHALEKPDRKIILASISKLIRAFEDLLKLYEKEYGPCAVKNRRIAANILSFVPAMVALRSWDLAAHATREEVNDALLRFILVGLQIPFEVPASRDVAKAA
jgi:AcrR family transcriptional regulator